MYSPEQEVSTWFGALGVESVSGQEVGYFLLCRLASIVGISHTVYDPPPESLKYASFPLHGDNQDHFRSGAMHSGLLGRHILTRYTVNISVMHIEYSKQYYSTDV